MSSGTGSGYDQEVQTFSPEGRIFQIEYAMKAADNSGTTLGLCCTDGVVLAVEKILHSRMMEKGANTRCFAVHEKAGIAVAGLNADGRIIATQARRDATEYQDIWSNEIDGKELADRVAMYMHNHTCYWMFRPFGCAVLLASYTQDGPQLFTIDPAGSCWGYHACAVGKGRTVAKSELEKVKLGEVTCREAVKILADIIYQVHDDAKDKLFELEMFWVCKESKQRYVAVPADLVAEAEEEAKKKAA